MTKNKKSKTIRKAANREVPKAGPRLADVPRDYGKHEYQVRVQGKKREEFFPFVTESGAIGCMEGVKKNGKFVLEAQLMKRTGAKWKVIQTWRNKDA